MHMSCACACACHVHVHVACCHVMCMYVAAYRGRGRSSSRPSRRCARAGGRRCAPHGGRCGGDLFEMCAPRGGRYCGDLGRCVRLLRPARVVAEDGDRGVPRHADGGEQVAVGEHGAWPQRSKHSVSSPPSPTRSTLVCGPSPRIGAARRRRAAFAARCALELGLGFRRDVSRSGRVCCSCGSAA